MGPVLLLNAFELFIFWLWSALSVAAMTSWNYTSGMADSPISSLALLTLFFMFFGALFIWEFDRGVAALRDFETPAIKRLHDAHALEIATIERAHRDSIAHVVADYAELFRDYDYAVVDNAWALAMLQDQQTLNHEMDARIAYLEQELREFGTATPSGGQTEFAVPSHHQGPVFASASPEAMGGEQT